MDDRTAYRELINSHVRDGRVFWDDLPSADRFTLTHAYYKAHPAEFADGCMHTEAQEVALREAVFGEATADTAWAGSLLLANLMLNAKPAIEDDLYDAMPAIHRRRVGQAG